MNQPKLNSQKNRQPRKAGNVKKNKGKNVNNKRKDFSRIEAPISMGFQSEFSQPDITNRGQNVIIRHREYIGDLQSTSDFTVIGSFPMNPGFENTFPWLSLIAQRFEKYRFRKLSFSYETDSPTIASGSIMLVPDFDANDPAPFTKAQALSFKSSVRTQVWERVGVSIKAEDLKALPQYYVRSGVVPGSTDIKTYDVGNMFVCSSGNSGTAYGGELWVEYDVELIAPTTQPISSNDVGWSKYVSTGGFIGVDDMLGTGSFVATGTLDINLVTSATYHLFSFPSGFVGYIICELESTGTASIETLVTNVGTCTAEMQSQSIVEGDLKSTFMTFIQATPGQTFAYSAVVDEDTLSQCICWFAQAPAA
jgi:hypothetical protein